MKLILLLVSLTFSFQGFSQINLNKVKKAAGKDSSKVQGVLGGLTGKSNSGSLTNDEIIAGLKEALSTGAVNSTALLHRADGFLKNEAIKIVMPEEAKKVETTLRRLGMSSLVDKAIVSMNRAAEDAAGGATDIFISAIKGMTVTDGLNILRGGDFAATEFLKQATTVRLTEQFRPVIEQSLDKVNATAYWEDVFKQYNKVSPNKVETDLAMYVTERALNGLFHTIALEEQKIRKNPAARVSDILKKVFGS
ncbi:MAG: DUF4197 domain-containing protein [Ferruginibacter sp.]|nr:DUF4197 domain-containing protein [Ferruginibacter sp.]